VFFLELLSLRFHFIILLMTLAEWILFPEFSGNSKMMEYSRLLLRR